MRTVCLALVLVLAACGGDDDDDATPDEAPCEDVYASGQPVDVEGPACADNGELTLVGTATTACADGRTLAWNDHAWGYAGEEWNPHEPGGELVAPEAERDACAG